LGTDIKRKQFKPADYRSFRQRLMQNLDVFQQLLAKEGFGKGPTSFGAELELYIIDKDGSPLPINELIHQKMDDPLLTLELNRFNLEYNFTPVIRSKQPFSQMETQMLKALNTLSSAAEKLDARVLPIGILPTLKTNDLGKDAITDITRYHVLAKALRDKRGENFQIHIEGIDCLDLEWADVSLEGANTSFQFHYRVDPEHFANSYNAAQLVSPLAMAIGANSPMFLNKTLWHETRIALFKQSIDYRVEDSNDTRLPSRVLFGLGWVRKDIHEMFAEGAYLFDPLLPVCSEHDPKEQYNKGQTPLLEEMRLHQGSIWTWNRPIYDPADDGHLRIELRSMPAGPTPANMMANAALMSGLMRGLRDEIGTMLPGMPFRYAEQNFYRAAKYGLGAKLFWPCSKTATVSVRPVTDIINDILPKAEQGLSLLGVDKHEITKQMDVIRGGVETGMNGAQWQINMLNSLRSKLNDDAALSAMVNRYYELYRQGKPVHEWSLRID
jgi:gamma-glutamyl:cysteine ligase YbdK (ATP-grasp superfamily)